ncbi:hypothetical protein HAX54_041453 [Datura stramonium]|uniref:Uncharacterized protein n=1 Tax=Datura stramonium TaxID=4076 RepID=A0ABS8VQL9_DATST|nr:hypothetical protein [Datura stramonium]
MYVIEYEMQFDEFSRHVSMIMSTEHEQVATRGLDFRVVLVVRSPEVGVFIVKVTLSTLRLAGPFRKRYSSRSGQSSSAGSSHQQILDRGFFEYGELGHFVRDCPRFRQQGQLIQSSRAPPSPARGGAQDSKDGPRGARVVS